MQKNIISCRCGKAQRNIIFIIMHLLSEPAKTGLRWILIWICLNKNDSNVKI